MHSPFAYGKGEYSQKITIQLPKPFSCSSILTRSQPAHSTSRIEWAASTTLFNVGSPWYSRPLPYSGSCSNSKDPCYDGHRGREKYFTEAKSFPIGLKRFTRQGANICFKTLREEAEYAIIILSIHLPKRKSYHGTDQIRYTICCYSPLNY